LGHVGLIVVISAFQDDHFFISDLINNSMLLIDSS
jgi:hypothetical protein